MAYTPGILTGVVAILVTPFTDDDRLDLDGLEEVVEHTLKQGAHGLGIGLASEYLSLTDQECIAVARVLVKATRRRVPVMMSCGRPSTAATIDLAQALDALELDALMVLPPYFMPPGSEGLEAHYRAVAAAVQTPIVLQDAPDLSRATLPPTLIARLAREVVGIRYLKIEAVPTVPKIAALARLLAEDPENTATLIGGAGGLHFVDELQGGARATMPGCAYTDLFARIWDLYNRGDTQGARHALYAAIPTLLMAGRSFTTFVGTQKEWLRREGVIGSARLRAPAEQLTDDVYAEFAERLAEWR